ncbi:hypothetical protein QBC37DRAFT_77470 [Rhypophila decipiens]|uniref:Arrestin-like N-terminal domain-containing protein n=1 Tax=Rhypophila decipiens TaxID=261697 RepID=A0AAN6YFU7_9PEZI|nr:hypothetical protein QBC37DRAFT_77470 [Rhypophila decipiens]
MTRGDRIDLEPIKPKSGPPLAIHLNVPPVTVSGQPTTFLPADTITGFVSREEPIIAPHGTIEIALIGRSAVHYAKTRRSGNATTTTHYYSKVILFEEKQTLLDGPLHIAPDHGILPSAAAMTTNTWPFSFQIPTHASATSSNLHEKNPARSFLPIEPESLQDTLTNTPLPASFNFHPGYSDHQLDAWVEYYLEATLTEEHASTSFFSGQPKTDLKSKHACLPILVSNPPAAPVHDFGILRHVIPNQSVSSQRLLPGRGKDAKLSTHEHLSKLFKSSSVPKFGFAVEMEFPTVLQLGNEMPLGIRILSDGPGGDLSSDAIKGVEQTVTLESIRLRILERVDGKIEEEYSKKRGNYCADGKVYVGAEFGQGSSWEQDGRGEVVVPCVGGFRGVAQGKEGLSAETAGDEKGFVSEKEPEKKKHRLSWSGRSNKSTSSRKSKEEEAGYSLASSDGGSPRVSSEEEKVPGYTYHPTNEGSWSSGPGGDGSFLQLGEKMNLRLQQDCVTGLGIDPEAKVNKWDVKHPHWKWVLAPSFATFNISVKYLLKWEVTLNIVGEKVKLSAEHGVMLLPGWS